MRKSIVSAAFILLALILCRTELVMVSVAGGSIGTDFWHYFTASWMVRSGQSLDIYKEGAQSDDLFYMDVDPNGIFARTASVHGIPMPSFHFTYPPTLADLLVPFTFLRPANALAAWYVLSAAALLLAGILLARMPGMHLSGCSVSVLAFLCLLPPTADCLLWGQVSILIVFLLVAGLYLYAREKRLSAASLFALAAAIKLTPLIVLFPLLGWRDWKTLRALAVCCAAILGALLTVNGWAALGLYFLHEMPKMGSTGMGAENRTLGMLVEVLWSRSRIGVPVAPSVLVGKLLSALVICYAAWLSRSRRNECLDTAARVETIAIFLLLSCCVSPVSWLHAYVLSAPALVILGRRIWENRLRGSEVAVALLFALSLITTHFRAPGLLTPVLGIVLGLMGLLRLRGERPTAESGGALLPAGS
ncbi:MAG: glycosyltransferase family 87 protein [Terracidiphilus sp.]